MPSSCFSIVILIVYFCINLDSLKLYFLYVNIIWTFTKLTLFTLKVSFTLNCFTSSVCHGVEKYFPGLWGMGISDAIFEYIDVNVGMLINK